jgi:multidrug efflux pump
MGRDFHIGAPSTDYWIQLATGVAGGLLFATPITLLFTPAMLVLLDRSAGARIRSANDTVADGRA